MRRFAAIGLVAFGSMLAVACRDKKAEACAHLLVEVTEAHMEVSKVRDDKSSKLDDIGKKLKKEAKELKEEKVDDKKLSDMKDDYADNLKVLGEAYIKVGSSEMTFEKFLAETTKVRKDETEIQESIVSYCKVKKS